MTLNGERSTHNVTDAMELYATTGDEAAASFLFKRYSAWVNSLASAYFRSSPNQALDAEETALAVWQDIFCNTRKANGVLNYARNRQMLHGAIKQRVRCQSLNEVRSRRTKKAQITALENGSPDDEENLSMRYAEAPSEDIAFHADSHAMIAEIEGRLRAMRGGDRLVALLGQMMAGKSNSELANAFQCSPKTVEGLKRLVRDVSNTVMLPYFEQTNIRWERRTGGRDEPGQ